MARTIANKGERLYIDSNVLVYYFYSKQRRQFFKKSKKLLEKIANNKFEGVISSLTLMELVKALRELLVQFGQIRKVEDVEEIIHKNVSSLFAIGNIRFVEGGPPDFESMPEVEELYFCTVCREALATINECTGKPDIDRETGRIVHKGLHAPDILHIILAKKLQCDKLATFEWNFKEAKDEIVPLILQDYNAIW